jgi:hypothetical protein
MHRKYINLDKLIPLELESVTILDKLDVPTKLSEFSGYKEGWFDGISGKEFDSNGIEWLSNMFDKYFQPDILLPYTFPTPQGEIQFEWKKGNHDLTLYVNILNKSAYLHYQNMKDDNDSHEKYLNLNNEKDWKELLKIVSNYF